MVMSDRPDRGRLMVRNLASSVALGALLSLGACSDDDDESTTQQPTAGSASAGVGGDSAQASATGGTGGTATTSNTASSTQAVIYSVLIRDQERFSEYMTASPTGPSGDVDTSKARELPGGNYYATEDAIYYGNFETKTLQRYVVREDYSTDLTGEFSLAQYGVNYINQEPMFFSSTSAYYVDPPNLQIIKFNPTTMEITGELPLNVPDLTRTGFTPRIGSPQKIGDRFVTTITYTNSDATKIPDDSTFGLVFQDNDQEPVRVLRDTRGTLAWRSFVDDAGDFYALADGQGGYYSLTGLQQVQSPQLLRIKRDANEVDSTYALDLGKLLNTPAVNGLWPISDTKFVVQAWASDQDPSNALKTAADYDTAPYFDWVLVDAVTQENKKIDGIARAAASYSLLRFKAGDRRFVQQYIFKDNNYDDAHVELYEVKDDASAVKIAETSRGDFRLLTSLNIIPK